MIRVTAPGKMVLLGEYAVLDGAPAVVAAVNRRVAVNLARASGTGWIVSAPGFDGGAVECEIGDGGEVRWRDEASRRRYALVDGIFKCLATGPLADLVAPPGLEAVLDSREFFHSTPGGTLKLGLGSSAALTVALITALASRDGGGPPAGQAWLETLVGVHREIQGGLGSGIDVAASINGGVLSFRLDRDQRPTVSRVALPSGLHLRALWTGEAASTGAFLEQLRRRRLEGPREVDGALGGLGRASEDGINALAAGDSSRFLDAVDCFWSGLEDLGRAIRMPIVSESHRSLRRLAERHGVCYKPSGAGGGDLGVGFAFDPDRLEEFSEAAAEAGYPPLDVEIDAQGARLERP